LSPGAAFATVQKGIDEAKDGDSIQVYPGIYTGEINFGGKAVTLQSIGDAAVLENPDRNGDAVFLAPIAQAVFVHL